MQKIVASFVLVFLVLSLFTGLQFVCSVSANFLPAPVPEHSIEIAADGTVNGTDMIQREGNVYTFTGDVEGTVVVLCDGIVVDGAGFSLPGSGDLTGVWLQAAKNVEIKNLHIRNFEHGIKFTYGLAIEGCTNVTVSGNTITDNEYGLSFMMFSKNNSVLDNKFANNTFGVYVSYSANNVFRNNQMTQNRYNFWLDSQLSGPTSEFVNDVDVSNTVDGKPLIYWVNRHNETVPSDAGYVALMNCTNITVQGLALTNNSHGVLLIATNSSLITGNYVGNNFCGVEFHGSHGSCYDNVVSGNNVTENVEDGIYSRGSYNTTVTGNSITNNQRNDVHFYKSPDAYIVGNFVTGNIEVTKSENSTVEQNNVEIPDDEIPDSVPEFPQWVPLLIMLVAVLGVASVYKRSLNKQNLRRKIL